MPNADYQDTHTIETDHDQRIRRKNAMRSSLKNRTKFHKYYNIVSDKLTQIVT